jgi:hypothetical protein
MATKLHQVIPGAQWSAQDALARFPPLYILAQQQKHRLMVHLAKEVDLLCTILKGVKGAENPMGTYQPASSQTPKANQGYVDWVCEYVCVCV